MSNDFVILVTCTRHITISEILITENHREWKLFPIARYLLAIKRRKVNFGLPFSQTERCRVGRGLIDSRARWPARRYMAIMVAAICLLILTGRVHSKYSALLNGGQPLICFQGCWLDNFGYAMYMLGLVVIIKVNLVWFWANEGS